MPDQTARQRARRTALDAQAKRRERRAQRERTLGALGVEVVTALAERDAVSASCEVSAGRALVKMTDDEGLTVREALDWCGWDALTVREVARLQQVAREADSAGQGSSHATEADGPGEAGTPAPAVPAPTSPGAVQGVFAAAGGRGQAG